MPLNSYNSSSNNTLTSNTANNNNYYGIYLDYSLNNTLTNNTVNNNSDGLYMSDSANNSIIQNIVCFNFGFGEGQAYAADIFNFIYNINETNYGINNTCDTTFNHNDTNATGCKNKCIG